MTARRRVLARLQGGRRRVLVVLGLGLFALVLGGCNAPTFGAFHGVTTQGRDEFHLWVGMVIAGLTVAVIVWGLIFYAVIRYRRRDDTMPRQFREYLPIEIIYTAIPLVIVAVIFYFTVIVENQVDAVTVHPNEQISVLAYRWGWRFSYSDGSGASQGVVIQTPALALSELPQPATETKYYPQLVMPSDETTRIILTSRDVVHGFYVPEFNFSRYALPGVTNIFDFTPTTDGTYRGQCTQFCGLYHADMLFSVKVVSPAQFQAWLSSAQTSQATGGKHVTLLAERPAALGPSGEPEHEHGPTGILKWITSTDHKVIGKSYLITSFIFFLLAGCMAVVMRTQLASPDNTLVSQHLFNELFTMHGSLMLYLFAGPFAFGGLANYIVPLQVGAPDMAFPRLNALSYWLYLGGGTTMMAGFLVVGGAADFGWVAYAPLSNAVNSPGAGPDMWIVALVLTGFSAIFTGVNIITTVFYLRAPGMTMFRLPIFTWNMTVTGILILIAFPVLTAALIMLWCDRHLGTYIYTLCHTSTCTVGGVPVLWQNLFWFFGHPEVYILALPYFGIVTDVIPVFSRKPLFGYKGMVFATIAIGALSTAVWAHHMFTTGVVLLPFFSLMSYLIAVPTGIKFFNWIGSMWRGSLKFDTPMLFAVGFLVVFLFGGVTGIFLASPPVDFATHDTYFVVAHFHQVLFGSAVFAGFAGLYFWYPKITGRMMREGLGKLSFWLMIIGFFVTFMPQYLVGLHGMPRRIADYSASTGWTTLNRISTVGAYFLFSSVAVMLVNFYVSWRRPVVATGNPWDADTLEWATTSPPPHHNFVAIPPIRSERPVWDANHPEHRSIEPTHQRAMAAVAGTAARAWTRRGRDVRVEGLVLLVLTVFCAIVAFIFWAFGLHDIYRQITGGGTIMLVAVALLGLLPGGYYLWWSRRMTPRAAEDDPLADPSSSAGVVGAFPSSSVWPFVLGMAALLVALALVFGFWSAVFGITLALSAVVGIIMESRRGGLV